MNKTAIQKYAIEARRELIKQVKDQAFRYGIDEKGYGEESASVIEGRVLTAEEKQQRQAFVAEIKKHGFLYVVEEIAYTWFNRFIALRYMEVNDYLPTHVRVFSDANGGFNPEILKDVLHLDLPGLDKAKVSELLNASKTEELYRYLLITQCNALNAALPEMFEKLGSYTEMLLPNNILKQDSVIGRLVTEIPEEDFRDAVQIIGWLYQYYNTEPKQAVFDGLKKNVKISKEKIPAATQLFTPDWIVRYMVENSLGRLWLESHPNDALKSNWKYYLDEAEQIPKVVEKLRVQRSESSVKSPEDIRLIDPCMGSGHILVYAFDVLMQIYESEGYNPRDAAKLILEKNIYGLDIDRRAYQLSYFSLLMKARQYNRRIFTFDFKPQVYYPAGFPDGEEFGSLLKVTSMPPKPEMPKEITLFTENYETTLNAWNFKRLLAQKYDVVVTNPPYMGGKGMSAKLSDFVKNNYPDSKSDLFAVFIEKCGELMKPTGYQAMITQHSWMFLSSYEKLRKKLLRRGDIVNMAHLGARAFEEIGGEVVQTTAFVLSRRNIADFGATFVRLVDYNSQNEKEEAFLSGDDRYIAKKENFAKIPGNPIAYWVSAAVLNVYEKGRALGDIAAPRKGNSTSNNARFLRLWHEIEIGKANMCAKEIVVEDTLIKRWYPYNKGGGYRKWFGFQEYLIDWYNDAQEIRNIPTAVIANYQYFTRPGLTWSTVTSANFSIREFGYGFIFDNGGCCIFDLGKNKHYLLGLLNSNVFKYIFGQMNPTLNFQSGEVAKFPVIESENKLINELSQQCVVYSRTDWDSFETSWDFKHHPLVCGERTVETSFKKWDRESSIRFDMLKANEEELNRIFIEIYGLQDELTPNVKENDVTVRRADLDREVRSFISYAVGCIFGRYSLDVEGLAYAGGNWDSSKYKSYMPDIDNIIPICDDEYFDDDITGRFVEFVKTAYGEEALEENLTFIANALGGKGTSREIIRNYFLKDFYKDHCKIYQKRPIYWLFDSGKKNGFKALIYMHRYSHDLLAKMRTDYVHEQQERYRTQIGHIDDDLGSATGAERAKLLKQQNKLNEQLAEVNSYEEKIHHIADQNIDIDLDDGVKKNYELFADVLAKI